MHYPIPIHRTGAYADLGLGAGSLPVAERLAEHIVTLPLSPYMTDDEIAHVVDAVRDYRGVDLELESIVESLGFDFQIGAHGVELCTQRQAFVLRRFERIAKDSREIHDRALRRRLTMCHLSQRAERV